MNFVKGEICVVDSNGAIVISDVVNSTINVGEGINEELVEVKRILNRLVFQSLNVIVISQVEVNDDESLEYWKPFGHLTCKDLISKCIRNFDIKGTIINIAYGNFESSNRIDAYLSYLKTKSIVIIDSRVIEEHFLIEFAKKFDDHSIGGLITVNYQCDPETIDSVNSLFNYLQIYRNEFPGIIDTDHVRMSISSEAEFINSFCAICRNKFKLPSISFGIDTSIGLENTQF